MIRLSPSIIGTVLSALLHIVILTLASSLATHASDYLMLCETGSPAWGTLHMGNGGYSLVFKPPLEANNAFYPKRIYNISLQAPTSGPHPGFVAFHLTPTSEKAGPISPEINSHAGPTCPDKSGGISLSIDIMNSQTYVNAMGSWKAPPSRTGTVSLRWTVITPRESVFSEDAESTRYYIQSLSMPELDLGCKTWEQVPWMGFAGSEVWDSGFVRPVLPDQSVKAELKNGHGLTINGAETVNIASLELSGGTLSLGPNARIIMNSYLSNCFDRQAFVPTNVTVVSVTHSNITVAWLPTINRPDGAKDHTRYRISVYEGIVRSGDILGPLQQVRYTNGAELKITIEDLNGNTSYVLTVGSESDAATGAESAPIEVVTETSPSVPPPNPCDELPQLSWLPNGVSGWASPVSWKNGFTADAPPKAYQSVRVELVGSGARVLFETVNTTIGSLLLKSDAKEQWLNQRLVVGENASLILTERLQDCYEQHATEPTDLKANHITSNGFNLTWSEPESGTASSYFVRVFSSFLLVKTFIVDEPRASVLVGNGTGWSDPRILWCS